MSDYYDVLMQFQNQSKDPNWDSVCWLPKADCPNPAGHISAEEKLANPPTSEARTVDLELRNAGVTRKSAAYEEMAKAKGYANMEALHAGVKSEVNPV